MEQPASWTTAEFRSPGCALLLLLPAMLLCPSLALLVFYLSLVLPYCRLLHLLQPLLRLRFFIVIYVSTEKTVPTSCMSPGFIVIDLGRPALGGGYYSDIHRLMWWSVLFLHCMILRRRAMGWEPTFFWLKCYDQLSYLFCEVIILHLTQMEVSTCWSCMTWPTASLYYSNLCVISLALSSKIES